MTKLLPMRYREKQSDWFGQVGMSLHISHVILASQSVSTSSSISSQTNSTRVLEHHTFCHFFERCSQNGQTGFLIERIDYSEAQAGKSVCDCRSADLKAECRRYVHEGHDITNSTEFIDGRKSTNGFSIVACELIE